MLIFEPTNYGRDDTAPDFTKDMIIMEMSPYLYGGGGFGDTGDGEGTWSRLLTRLSYIQELGVNTIWVIGHNLVNEHYWNCKSAYAVNRFDEFDPALGTPEEFKAFIDDAHSRGIRVVLDCVTIGVVQGSSIVDENPNWFTNKDPWKYRMNNYNFEDCGFRTWYKNRLVSLACDYEVDGYRVDVSLQDVDLWDDVVETCKARARDIVIFGEWDHFHFAQNDNMYKFSTNVAADIIELSNRYNSNIISIMDDCEFKLKGSRFEFGYSTVLAPYIPIFYAGNEFNSHRVGIPKGEMNVFGEDGEPGGGGIGVSRSNYSLFQWNDLNYKDHMQMYDDIKNILNIRKNNSDIINADKNNTSIIAVSSTPNLPVPYAYYKYGQKAIVVVGNNTITGAGFVIDIPLLKMGLAGKGVYKITDLMKNQAKYVSEEGLTNYPVYVRGDRQPGGGLAALKIEPATGAKPEPLPCPVRWTIVDDRDTNIIYSNGFYTEEGGSINNTFTSTTGKGNTFEYTFTGNSITWFSNVDPYAGEVDIYMDGIKDEHINLHYEPLPIPEGYNTPVYTKSGLSSGKHTIKIVATRSGLTVRNDGFEYSTNDTGAQSTAYSGYPHSNTVLTIGNTKIENDICRGNSAKLCAFKYNLRYPAELQSLNIYVENAIGKMYMGMYSDVNSVPGNLVASTDEFLPVQGWNTINVIRPVKLMPGNYWLAIKPENDLLTVKSYSAFGDACYALPVSYDSLPSSFPKNNACTGKVSLYATLMSCDYEE